MTLTADPAIGAALASFAPDDAPPPPGVGDVATRRATSKAAFDAFAALRPAVPGVAVQQHLLTTADGAAVPLTWYYPEGAASSSGAVLYLHGGGMIVSFKQLGRFYDALLRDYVAATGVPMLLVDYRVAPEHPDPAPVQDCYAALQWLHDNAERLGVDPARVAVAGDSAGGGLAAGVTLLARDRGGPPVALQVLMYPMLDNRTTTPDPELPTELLVWTYDDNVTGWQALLGAAAGESDVSLYAAPAHAADLAGLPPTYIDVGNLDIFRDEDLDYARRLVLAGVPTEFHLYPGCPHGFEAVAPDAEVSRLAMANRFRRIAQL